MLRKAKFAPFYTLVPFLFLSIDLTLPLLGYPNLPSTLGLWLIAQLTLFPASARASFLLLSYLFFAEQFLLTATLFQPFFLLSWLLLANQINKGQLAIPFIRFFIEAITFILIYWFALSFLPIFLT